MSPTVHTWPDPGLTLTISSDTTVRAVSDGIVALVGTGTADGRIVVADATVNLAPAGSSRLVNGYQSWDYAGVRSAAEPGLTWWGGAIAGRRGGLAFLTGTAERLATAIRTEPAGDSHMRLLAQAGGTPELLRAPPSWGFVAGDPTPIDLSGLGITESEPLLVAADRDPMTAMEKVAAAAGRLSGTRPWNGPSVLGWESWYHYGTTITPEVILANARLLRDRFPDRFSTVQIDDGWQRSYGDWRPRDGWPDDLRALSTDIVGLGCRPGLWLAPFMVTPGEAGTDVPDVLIGHAGSSHALRDPLMNRHGLDATHPAAIEWLHALGARVRSWGFSLVKLDFLYIGAQEGRRHDATVTGTEALRRGLSAFVAGLGDDAYVLGCGMPFSPAVGICHGNRIGGDLAAPRVWGTPEFAPFDPDQGWLGVAPTARNAAARWWAHGRLFHNDPDVVMAAGPDAGPPYTVDEARALLALAAAVGGPLFLADDLAALSPAKRAALEDRSLLDLAWSTGARPGGVFEAVDTAPAPDFYTQPSALPPEWSVGARRVRFDWEQRRATLA